MAVERVWKKDANSGGNYCWDVLKSGQELLWLKLTPPIVEEETNREPEIIYTAGIYGWENEPVSSFQLLTPVNCPAEIRSFCAVGYYGRIGIGFDAYGTATSVRIMETAELGKAEIVFKPWDGLSWTKGPKDKVVCGEEMVTIYDEHQGLRLRLKKLMGKYLLAESDSWIEPAFGVELKDIQEDSLLFSPLRWGDSREAEPIAAAITRIVEARIKPIRHVSQAAV